MQSAPVQSTPVQSTPVQSIPVQSAPVQSTPVQSTPVQSTPVQSTPVQSTPVQSFPVQSTPVQSIPVQSAPVQSTPVQSTPVQLTRGFKQGDVYLKTPYIISFCSKAMFPPHVSLYHFLNLCQNDLAIEHLVDLESCTFGDECSYTPKGAYGRGYLLAHFVHIGLVHQLVRSPVIWLLQILLIDLPPISVLSWLLEIACIR